MHQTFCYTFFNYFFLTITKKIFINLFFIKKRKSPKKEKKKTMLHKLAIPMYIKTVS